ncbi:hypothetical protein FBU59_003107 [Linderina macrospora]|uniref:Uncharacterized protein n=1 Tax=Linderina macrospora TaxID=4868 RepID=A0ACC1J9K9_9FUNG|nr:hypothetical protein FBU59_003107 [Linderina macrospora]
MVNSPSFERYIDSLRDKVVIVTGAASGFGKRLSEQLADYQAKVMMVDIHPNVKLISDEINTSVGTTATACVTCDVCDASSIQGFFDKTIELFGHIDVVVNNAGIANECSLFSQSDDVELDRILNINLRAPMIATRIAGVVVNTASVGGLLPISLMESYGTTKAGLIFFTTSCRGLAPTVRVNAVAPYFADTSLVAHNRLVNAYPLIRQIGLMSTDKVVKTMIKAMCDETLAGDTLLISMGNRALKLGFYDKLTADVTSYIASGTVNKYAGSIYTAFASSLDYIIKLIRSPN